MFTDRLKKSVVGGWLAVVALAFPAAAHADDDAAHGRVRYVDPGVVLQRAGETGSEDAQVNEPVLPGDRVWTDGTGRVELQFDDGTIVRVDTQTKIDLVGPDDRGTLTLRLWSGGLYVHTEHESDTLVIETPGGYADAIIRGVFRVDAVDGETRLSVYEGEVSLDSGRRRERVTAGERSYARRGEVPDPARRFNVAEEDDFSRWDAERSERAAYAGEGRRYLPEAVAPYAAELDAHGSWYYEGEVGYVWRPYVGASWRPYSDGRWVWTSYGWTWVPAESWGWAPSHYGRWGWTAGSGWYWIPGSAWSPAWVSWAVGPDYVGWCPLGRRDQPVFVAERLGDRGHAIPRGGVLATDSFGSRAWVFTRRSDVGARDVARRRVDVPAADLRQVQIMDTARVRPGRDLRPTDAHALVRTKPTPADFMPELRHSDPPPAGLGRVVRPDGVGGSVPVRDPAAREGGSARERTHDVSPHPTDLRHAPGRTQSDDGRSGERPRGFDRARDNDRPPTASDRTRDSDRPRDGGRDADRSRDHETQERDVLRRFFQPTTDRDEHASGHDRDRGRDDGARSHDGARGGSSPGAQGATPRNTPPPPPPPPRPSGNTAAPRDKDKQH